MSNEDNYKNDKCIEDVVIPDGFRALLQELSDAVLRHQPSDILSFSVEFLSAKLVDRNKNFRLEEEAKKKREMNKVKKAVFISKSKESLNSQKMENTVKSLILNPQKIILESELFTNSNHDLLRNLAKAHEVKNIAVGEEISFSNSEMSPLIYFIQNGKFEIFSEMNGGKQKIGELSNRGYFGDYEDQIVVVSKSPSKLIAVRRSDIDSSVLEEISKRREEYSQFINDMNVFEKLNNFWKRILIDSMIPKLFMAGQEIFSEGSDGYEMYLINDGFISIQTGGKEINYISEGCYFGELALLDNVSRVASAISISDSKLMAISKTVVKTIIEPLCREQLDKQIKSYFHEKVDDDDDQSDIITPPFEQVNMPRKSVSAGKFNPEMDDEDDDYDMFEGINGEDLIKTEEQKARLQGCCKSILLFRCLDDEELEVVIGAMFQKVASPGDVIIRRGDDGDNFYVIDNGIFDIIVPVNNVDTIVAQYTNEGSFGELALMYNTPRSATVIAKTDGLLWAMNREMFRRIVLKKAFKKRLMYENLLLQVSLFKNISDYERSNVADALRTRIYEAGMPIIRQGEEGLEMFFIEEGKVEITVDYEDGLDPEKIGELARGKYFGEMALINQKPRVATITALTRSKIAVLDRESFERLLGPCVDVMKRNMKDYEVITQRKSTISQYQT